MCCTMKNLRRLVISIGNFRSSSTCTKLSHKTQDTINVNKATKQYPYYFEDGLRKVYSYYYEHKTYCKGRWINQNILDVYCKEFALYPEEVFKDRIKRGLLKVNNMVVNVDYVLKNKDLLSSITHRHELPVLACPLKILFEDDNFLVLDKPPSIPVHPCGLYNENSILNILSNDYKRDNIYVIYRLDRLTSGVLVLTKSKQKSRQIHDEMDLRHINKEYICRVEGNFPDGEIICNEPIKQFYHKVGVALIHPEGKVSITKFKKLSYNGKSSVVNCTPLTGRTHQIRVHLQYLGHPIINDPIYNSFVFGNLKGKGGVLHNLVNDLLQETHKERSSHWRTNADCTKKISLKNLNQNLYFSIFKKYYNMNSININPEKDLSRITYDQKCFFCNFPNHNPEQDSLGIFLHAYKYQGHSWEFKSDLPFWALPDWDIA